MEVIQNMSNEEYDRLCAAGAELTKRLTKLLKELGLGMDAAPALLAVAAAGIGKGLNVDPAQFAEMIGNSGHLWRLDPREGGRELVFDPPHLRPDFVPVEPELAAAAN